jgi:hypothetical protein
MQQLFHETLTIATVMMPTFICMMLFFQPCMPPTFGYNVMNCEEMDYPSYSYFLSPILFLANIFSWYNAFGMAFFLIFPAFYLPQICLKEYVNVSYIIYFHDVNTLQMYANVFIELVCYCEMENEMNKKVMKQPMLIQLTGLHVEVLKDEA